MGARKHISAEKKKLEVKDVSFAKLNNCPTSPRKMRLVTQLISGKDVVTAFGILKHTPKEAGGRLYKLLLSAVNNWQVKNEGVRYEDSNLYVKEVQVDAGRMLKRISTAPQGRAHRIRKRSNHVTLVVDSRTKTKVNEE